MHVGKSTIARLLATQLGLPRRPLDKNRWTYFNEIGFDESHARRLVEEEGVEAALQYCKPFEVHAVERHLSESRDCVIDFGAGYSVQEDPALRERIRKALAPYPHVALLLPCADDDEAVACLNERVEENLRRLNEYYIRHPANRELAKAVVYTMGQSPEETCGSVLQALHLNLPDSH
jgi:shikimate kinase